ncbi:transitional endoplasmic reticulum ATPase [Thermanaeromonas toyohensis ToBE]|uniref:Transitional endoplasmic reticulum ATPase n=1 Tax=Thermanaeromonas toyohensis ToBE TaxID=698762 RepID=A0A1W1VZX9_9FIRM|nr:CDC48 family AAA ATPase [Thermanaeromonas toyohensis]SMB98681.1 transitional endoplasmic reticulum ATPase [Thermanaeromonas toyohensis ToBE]
MEDKVSLKVIEGMVEDARKGIVRVVNEVMGRLGLNTGDVVAITGKRSTVARVMPAFPDRCPSGSIQMDGTIRQNARVGLGEEVILERAEWQRAKVVVLAPVLPGWTLEGEHEITHIKTRLLGLAVVPGDQVSITLFSGREEAFTVEGVTPRGPVVINKDTTVRFKGGEAGEIKRQRVTYEDIGGLAREVQRVREIIELPLKYPQLFKMLGVDPPKGILLYGPPGTGKTLIARAVASETEAHFIHVNGPEIMHKYYGESEARLRQVFEEARKKAPSIIFLDEIDAIAPRRADVHGDVEKRVVAQLLALMDGLESRGNVVVIGATNIPDLVDPALRRPGRFDREIAINVPDQRGREEILRIHTRGMSLAPDVSIPRLAAMTHGFVGADLAALCREAGMYALRRVLKDIPLGSDAAANLELKVTMRDFLDALAEIEPSATREFATEIPTVSWEDVGGLDSIKLRLQALVEWPLKYPDLFQYFDLQAPKGILLSGPPGTGKTLVAKALARESQVNFIPVNSSLLFSHWWGEAEKTLHEVFRKARQASPCILFFDEIDALVPTRRGSEGSMTSRLVSQFLMELDGLEELREVIVLAATNRIDLVDPAILRPGRFDIILEFSPPGPKERLAILKVHLRRKPLAEDVNLEALANMTEGMVGSELEAICKRAALLALSEAVHSGRVSPEDKATWRISSRHLEQALREVLEEKGGETSKPEARTLRTLWPASGSGREWTKIGR